MHFARDTLQLKVDCLDRKVIVVREALERFTDSISLRRAEARLAGRAFPFLVGSLFLSGLAICPDAGAQANPAMRNLAALQSVLARPTLGVTSLAHVNPLGPGPGPKARYLRHRGNDYTVRLSAEVRGHFDIEYDFFPKASEAIPIKTGRFGYNDHLGNIEEVERLDIEELLRYAPTPKRRAKRPSTSRPSTVPKHELPAAPKRNPEFEKLGFDVLLVKGDELFRDGDYGKALEAYQAATRKKPGSALAMWAIAHAQFAEGDFDSAAASMHGALRVQPDFFDYTGIVRMFYRRTEDFDARMGALALRIQNNRNDFRGAFLAGVMLGLDAYRDLAGVHLEGALQLNPDDSLIPELLRGLEAEAIDDRPDGHRDETAPQPAATIE